MSAGSANTEHGCPSTPRNGAQLTLSSHVRSFHQQINCKTLYQFSDPVSPHIAARASAGVSDNEIRASVFGELHRYAQDAEQAVAILEGAGGVLSPSPSGTPQADLYRPLRLPTFLVGDHKLGGIGTTISAWESLHVRGYDVLGIGLFADDRYDNHSYLREYFVERNVDCLSVGLPPERLASQSADVKAMGDYYQNAGESERLADFTSRFLQTHKQRIEGLREMPAEANDNIWHPFLQHSERSENNIVAMDSAYGDFFQAYTTKHVHDEATSTLLKPAFDASASWWTQGLGHGNPRLALTAAHAAGRYGHVMFASAVHEPALSLAKTLIDSSENPRLSKVFYTDNGSTGMEVAVKMALRTAAVHNGWSAEDQIDILGLTNSYHGDTIGTMDCSEPSVFNKKVEWYRGRGHWLDFPQVKMKRDKWLVEEPSPNGGFDRTTEFDSLQQVFNFTDRRQDSARYRAYIDAELLRLRTQSVKIGALILEPIILGAGGMLFADPLFQRCLIDAVRSSTTTIPVIFDEVFTGLYRLGYFSAASLLSNAEPDIVVNAKLLTGGLLPLCTTTASREVFEAFLSENKSDALLHGHSYTAHAVGCAVANESLKTMTDLAVEGGAWQTFRRDWDAGLSAPGAGKPEPKRGEGHPEVWSMWSQSFVKELSHKPSVDSVFALGSVLSISLADPEGAGYASTAATGLRDALLSGSAGDSWVVHSRVLGNVLYLMAAMNTTQEVLRDVQSKVLRELW